MEFGRKQSVSQDVWGETVIHSREVEDPKKLLKTQFLK